MVMVITHRWDPIQFDAVLKLLTAIVAGDDPEQLNALTARLKSSADALNSAVNTQPPTQPS
jgi:hypothetical protein